MTMPGKRREWTFGVAAERIAEAAAERAAYHEGHEAHWAVEQARLEQEVRDKGMTLHEQQVTGGTNFVASVDAALGRQLNEARSKNESHRTAAEEYRRWERALKLKPNATLYLDSDDVAYFGL